MTAWLIGLSIWALASFPLGCLIGRILSGPKKGGQK